MSIEEHPRKKIRLEGTQNINDDKQLQKEIRSGITAFVSPNLPGFFGVLKQRFTDFLVNEIVPSGRVLHLKEIATPSGQQTKGAGRLNASEESPGVHNSDVKPTETQNEGGEPKSNDAGVENEPDWEVCDLKF
jgi:tRNA pseudouridine13 synthase